LRKYDSGGTELMRQDLSGLDPWSMALAPDGAIALVGSVGGDTGRHRSFAN